MYQSNKNNRHRGSDEGHARLLLEADAVASEGDVVLGGQQGDQAEDQPAAGRDGTEVIEAGPGAQSCSRAVNSGAAGGVSLSAGAPGVFGSLGGLK
ncbi:MAG: hypothetical protein ACK6BU_08355 [Cyanobacteriota bacterium]|jgi:hypothetical protein